MNYWLDFRLKIRDFFRKHRKKILIILIVWAVVIAVNYYLKNSNKEDITPKTTLNIHSPVIDKGQVVPENYKEPINVLVDSFVNFCNNKEYEKAYALLTNEYKNKFLNNIEDFKIYVDKKFETKKIYNIQNYSNFNGVYVYRVRFLEDILASGTTNGYNYEEEKIVIKLEDNTLRMALGGYIGEEDVNISSEDDYFKVNVVKKEIFYEEVRYNVELENKTSNYIVLADQTEANEVELQVGNENRSLVATTSYNMVILPNETIKRKLTFKRYPEETVNDNALIFNAVRVLPEFSGNTFKAEDEKKNAIKLYSLTINLQPQN